MKKYLPAEDIELIHSGTDYFSALEEVIDSSRETLYFQTYIFSGDKTGMAVIEALKRSAQRNVKVYLLVDAYGSFPFPHKIAEDLTAHGIHFRLFSPLFSSESILPWRRLHHKIVVADKKLALIGGINIADKYNSSEVNIAWLDYAVLIRGQVCEYLHLLCEKIHLKKKRSYVNSWEKNVKIPHQSNQEGLVRFRRNDWIRSKNEVHQSYIQAIAKAESSIIIVASYFLPGKNLRRILKKAAERGVEIKIILAGKSDVMSAKLAQDYLYGFYFKNNIQLYEWQNSVLHGKAMLVDNTWATIGSYNLNSLSHYVSIELNTDVINKKFINTFSMHLNEITGSGCTDIDLKTGWEKTNLFLRLRRWFAYNFLRIVMSFFISRKQNRKKNLWTR